MKYVTIFLLLFSITNLSAAEEDELSCDAWTFSETFTWLGCQASHLIDDAHSSAISSAEDYAKEQVKAAAFDLFITEVPLGQALYAKFGPNNNKESEAQKQLKLILDAVSRSTKYVISEINEIVNTRDYADLNSFNTQVNSYFIDSYEERKLNKYTLDQLWSTAVDLRAIFETHSLSYYDAKSYHAYISIVALELYLRTEKVMLDYSITGNIELIDEKLTEHFRNELDPVFSHIRSIDNLWRSSVEDQYNMGQGTIATIFGGAGASRQGYIEYNGNRHSFTHKCNAHMTFHSGLNKYQCSFQHSNDILEEIGLEKGKIYTYSYSGHNARSEITNGQSVLHPNQIYKNLILNHYSQLLQVAYQPSRSILDNWWSMTNNSGSREVLQVDIDSDQLIPHKY